MHSWYWKYHTKNAKRKNWIEAERFEEEEELIQLKVYTKGKWPSGICIYREFQQRTAGISRGRDPDSDQEKMGKS